MLVGDLLSVFSFSSSCADETWLKQRLPAATSRAKPKSARQISLILLRNAPLALRMDLDDEPLAAQPPEQAPEHDGAAAARESLRATMTIEEAKAA